MRLLRHLLSLPGAVARAFPTDSLALIETAIRESEKQHDGEIRFAVEAALDPVDLWRGVSTRQRAVAVFSELGVWDTEQNNGVLIYLLLAEHAIEVVADRGLSRHVAPEQWQQIVQGMSAAFRAGRYEPGLMQAVDAVTALLVRYFPAQAGAANANELPDEPVLG